MVWRRPSGCLERESLEARWVQEKKSPVFVVATANDFSQFRPEMLRKRSFDELFFVGLPDRSEREAIWEMQIDKCSRDAQDFEIVQQAKVTHGLTGSEIENAFVEALYQALDGGKGPTHLDAAQVLTEFVPLSKLIAEQIGGTESVGEVEGSIGDIFCCRETDDEDGATSLGWLWERGA